MQGTPLLASLALVLAACLPASARGAPTPESVLRPGESLWVDATTGAEGSYVFDLDADQFVHLEVRQDGADVVATVHDPSGALVREASEAGATYIFESISWTRSVPGRYTLRVRVVEAEHDGRFEVMLDPPRPASPADEEWLRHERDFLGVLATPRMSGADSKARAATLRRLAEGWRALGDERLAAHAQVLLGAQYYDNDAARGLEDCLDVADFADRSGDGTLDWGFACAASHLMNLGFLENAVEVGRELLARHQQAGERLPTLRGSKLNLGLHLLMAGRTAEATALLEDLVREAAAAGDRVAEAYGSAHLGRIHRDRGEYQEALDAYARAVAIEHRYSVIRPLHRAALASVQLALGDFSGAAASVQQAKAELQPGTDSRAHSALALVMGRVHAERGELDQAIRLISDDVALCRRDNRVLAEVDALVALGRVEAERGRQATARRHHEEALARSRSIRYPYGEALAQASLCALDDSLGVSGTACAAALQRSQEIGYRPIALISRYYLARAARRGGDLHAAREWLAEAIAAVDAQRLDLRRADMRQTFSASVDDIEDEYVDVLAALADAEPAGVWEARAFEAADARRGRSLWDDLAQSRVPIRQGVDATLLREEDGLRERLRAALARQIRGDVTPAAARELERSIGAMQVGLEDVAARIRRASPRYAALSQPDRPGLGEVRATLLGPDDLLLYFALGERRSFLWVVTRTSLERHPLPRRAVIEALARRTLSGLSGPRAARRDLDALGRMLLGPAASRLGAARVLVVADGALHAVPFAALSLPGTARPLLERSEIVHLPSAAVGVLLARLPARAGDEGVAVFADPVFQGDDERLALRAPAAPSALLASLPRELTQERGGLVRLPFTRQEAKHIEALAGEGGHVALDFDATREAALDARMASYRIVHFATHGLLNASRPELSGIVLSLVDREGRPQNGFLTSLDTFNLRLDADLVVLSGCRTALGKNVRSEGIVGLTRGFVYAGARGVLASLWPVDDAATAELMRAFYAGLLGPRKLAPPAALREAQQQVRRDPRWRAPYYWAAFQLQGVWPSHRDPGN